MEVLKFKLVGLVTVPPIFVTHAPVISPLVLSISSIFSNVFFGVVVSLIASIFLKKEGNPFQQEATESEEKAE